jgi:two-component system LytT family sensor kinase
MPTTILRAFPVKTVPSSINRILVHAFCWLLYIIYEQSAIVLAIGKFGPLGLNLFYYGCNIALFYSQRIILLKTAGRTRPGYVAAVVLTLFGIAVYLSVKIAVDFWMFGPGTPSRQDLLRLLILDFQRSLYFVGMSTLIWSVAFIGGIRRKLTEAEKLQLTAERDRALLEVQLTKAQAAYYQHQLNPHLLFNTLAFIHTSIYDCSPQASRSLLILSDILRFSLEEGDENDEILLQAELTQIRNLVELNHLRFQKDLALDIYVTGELKDVKIIPLILLTLTENLFKHGLINDMSKRAKISLSLSNLNELIFACDNYKKLTKEVTGAGKLGLRNVRIRLNQAYPGRHQLSIRDLETIYQLELKIQL